ncbi:MAG TPA: hypothetical protein VL860_00815, partial [Planctomycetota bacterium]|nr:hypothetical protein [Planctomycetota bacterium]
GPFTVTATSGAKTGTASVTVTALPNAAPAVATAATASPSPVTGTTTVLSVLGADDAGEPALIYTWSSVGPAAVTYTLNGTNASKNTTATFTKAGAYTFTATIRDAGALTVTSSVAVTVNQSLTTITVSPASPSVVALSTQNFTASGKDQFATAMAVAPVFSWSVSGGGTIGAATGIYTAGAFAGGPFTVTATSGAKSGTASVTVTGGANPISVSIPSINFNATIGSTTPVNATITLTNGSGSAITVTLNDGQVWLTETGTGGVSIPAGGSSTFTVTADPTGLNGTFNGTLTITNTPGGATQTVPVNFTVSVAGGAKGGKRGGCEIGASSTFPGIEFAAGLCLLLLVVCRQHRRNA